MKRMASFRISLAEFIIATFIATIMFVLNLGMFEFGSGLAIHSRGFPFSYFVEVPSLGRTDRTRFSVLKLLADTAVSMAGILVSVYAFRTVMRWRRADTES